MTIVDRPVTETALQELELQMSGLVDHSQVLRVGQFVGATHIYLFTVEMNARTYSVNGNMTVVRTLEIIDLETSTLVTMSMWRSEEVDGNTRIFLDGREYVMDDGVYCWK